MVRSVYNMLEKNWNKFGYNSYSKQNIILAGENEWNEICDGKSFYKTNYDSDRIIELLIKAIKNNTFKELKECIIKFEIIKCYSSIVRKINILINESIIGREDIRKIAVTLVKEYNNSNLIKLGLILLRFNDDEESLNILKIFSSHNEYIFYSIEGIKEFNGCNSIIFEIAKGARGFGKIISIANLEPLTDEITEWLIANGRENDFLESILAEIIFSKLDFAKYFSSNNKTVNRYKHLTDNLSLLYEMQESYINNISIDMIKIYCDYFKNYKYDFNNIYVMCGLLSLFYKVNNEKVLVDNLNLSEEEENFIDNEIELFLKNDYSEIIKEAIDKKEIDINKIIEVTVALDIYLSFDELLDRLKYNYKELTIYNYIFSGENDEDKQLLVSFAIDNISFDDILLKNENIAENILKLEYIEDYCFLLVLLYMSPDNESYISLNLIGLRARYLKTRIEALSNLVGIKERLRLDDINEIEKIYIDEIDEKQRVALRRFIGTLSGENDIVRYRDIERGGISKGLKDIYLDTIVVKRDYESFTCRNITKNQGVFLDIDRNNLESINQILLLDDEGNILGNLCEKENIILKNLINSGKMIYGNIINISKDCDEIEVEIYLSHDDIFEEVSSTLNMIIKTPDGYLN